MSFDCKHLSMQLNPFFRELSRDLCVCIVGQLSHGSVFKKKKLRFVRGSLDPRVHDFTPGQAMTNVQSNAKKDCYQFGTFPSAGTGYSAFATRRSGAPRHC